MVKNLTASVGDARDEGLIPGSGRSCGGGNSNPLQYSWASLVAQLLKNPSGGKPGIATLGGRNPAKQPFGSNPEQNRSSPCGFLKGR